MDYSLIVRYGNAIAIAIKRFVNKEHLWVTMLYSVYKMVKVNKEFANLQFFEFLPTAHTAICGNESNERVVAKTTKDKYLQSDIEGNGMRSRGFQ